ncbi:hypothetical protein BROUX41_000540 [Berkeleyomyces rouxiae]|uniref:uncharacterized protein n=1 Tax=Berkeleyomyces rouxiae TaxID=2035830 RepID=UPI003B765FA2
MADPENITIKHADHLLLEQQMVRLPFEQLRKKFRGAHVAIEKESASLKSAAQEAATSAMRQVNDRDATIESLDAIIQQVENLKNKLEGYADEEESLVSDLNERIEHIDDLYSLNTYQDVGYDAWSHNRLDRLIADYLLQQGFPETAKALAGEKGIEALVDVEPFVTWDKIRTSLQNHSVTEALAWCSENKKDLRKMSCSLEFMLRYQQYIEILRAGDETRFVKALQHNRKYLIPFHKQYPTAVMQACGLFAYRPEPDEDGNYSCETWSPSRWTELCTIFTRAFHTLYGIHSKPLLHVALSAGLSALKTPRCHVFGTEHVPVTSPQQAEILASLPPELKSTCDKLFATRRSRMVGYIEGYDARETMCPTCSPELNELAWSVPYANHTRSCVEHDMVVLPNRNVFSKSKLLDYSKKLMLPPDEVKDLRSGVVYSAESMKKIFIT